MDTLEFETQTFSIANGNEIILEENSSFKKVFLPTIVDLPHNNKRGVRGKVILIRKGMKENWEEYEELNIRSMTKGKWTEFELSLEATQNLAEGLQKCNLILKKYGVESGSYNFFDEEELVERKKIDQLINLFADNEKLLDDLLETDNNGLIEKVFKWLSKTEDIEKIVDKLDSLAVNDLDKINSAAGLANLKRVMAIWEENKDKNKSEKFWQDVLKQHTWILSQIFSTPTVLIQKEAYVGGKAHDNKGSGLVDFLLANPFTKDSVLIEIKKPDEPLLVSTPYRDLYPVTREIVGAVSQVLNYKGILLTKIDGIVSSSLRQGKEVNFEAINPSCVVIVGRLDSLKTQVERTSFEVYRKELGTVTLITFDELFDKVRSFIDLLETN